MVGRRVQRRNALRPKSLPDRSMAPTYDARLKPSTCSLRPSTTDKQPLRKNSRRSLNTALAYSSPCMAMPLLRVSYSLQYPTSRKICKAILHWPQIYPASFLFRNDYTEDVGARLASKDCGWPVITRRGSSLR